MKTSPFTLWNPDVEFPSAETMLDLDIVTHVSVERAQEGKFHYLHEATIAYHNDEFHICWANHPTLEANTKEELIRGKRSADALEWGEAQTWVAPPEYDSESWNHPVISAQMGRLWGFFTRWNDKQASTEIFTLNDDNNWQTTGTRIPGFIPFRAPERLPNGNWIISGEIGWEVGAVAISRGDDFNDWHTVAIPCPPEIELLYAEATLMTRGDELVAIMRPHKDKFSPVSVSRDWGESWTPIRLSNFPMARSQPYCGKLSTGQQFLISNCDVEEGRTLLSIAVTRPGENVFSRVWKIRHAKTPLIRLLGGHNGTKVGSSTQWSYPGVLEHEGKLYVVYTHGKEDCALSIIPLSALQA